MQLNLNQLGKRQLWLIGKQRKSSKIKS